MYDVLRKQKIGTDIYELEVEAPHVVKYARAGNFVMIRTGEGGERIPLTIADIGRKSITLVFKVNGATTSELSRFKKGMSLSDVAGPLGNDAAIGEFGNVCLVGGGTGCVTTYMLSKALKEAGNRIVNIVAAKSKDTLIWPDRFRDVSDELILCTDDGSAGEKCLATDALERLIRANHYHRVIIVGPPAMMKEGARLTYQRAKTAVHLSPIMMDGIGMCGGCRVIVGGETRFACVDGPEFDAHQVDFDSLIDRNTRFSEAAATEHHDHKGCVKSRTARRGLAAKRAPAAKKKRRVMKR